MSQVAVIIITKQGFTLGILAKKDIFLAPKGY